MDGTIILKFRFSKSSIHRTTEEDAVSIITNGEWSKTPLVLRIKMISCVWGIYIFLQPPHMWPIWRVCGDTDKGLAVQRLKRPQGGSSYHWEPQEVECCQRATGGRGAAKTEGPCWDGDSTFEFISRGIMSKSFMGIKTVCLIKSVVTTYYFDSN